MKIKLLPFVFAVTAFMLFSSFSLMYPGGAPSGRTGSPGDGASCANGCHNQTATTTPGLITSTIPGTGYVPGTTYSITAVATLGTSGKYGFEVSPQNASGTQLGTLVAGSGSKLVGGSKYVTQSSASSSVNTWTFSWIAPAAGTGPVTFYGAFARNYTGPTTLSTLTVQEAASSGPAAAGPITGQTTVCMNGTATYSVGTISGATSYVWSVPSGATISSGQGTTNISVSFGASAVSGSISVYGTNGTTNGASSSLSVTVATAPTQAAAINGNATACQTSSQTYSVTNATGVTFTWTVPSGSTINSGQGTNSINVTVGANSGNISVVPSNSCGTAAATTMAVTVNPAASQTSAITGIGDPCQASTQTYSVTSVSGITYNWTVPAGSTINTGQGTNSISVTLGASNGNISVVPSNTCGNGPATNMAVTVGLVPAQPSSIAGTSSPCSVATETYTVTNVAGVSYAWIVPTGAVINSGQGTNSINVTLGTNSGEINVTPSNSCGVGPMVSKQVNISTGPSQTSNISGASAPCQASSQTYSVTFVSGVDYTWTAPSGSSITSGQGTNSVLVTIGTNNGNVTVVPSNNCGNGATTTFQITVSLAPSVPSTPVGPDQVDLRLTTTSNYTTSTGAASYLWKLSPVSAGTLVGTTETAQVSWNSSFLGTAEISVKAQNVCGESTWSIVKNTQVINTTGVDVDATSIIVTSDKANGKISLSLKTNTQQANVMLLDLSGRLLVNTTVPGKGTTEIDQQLNSGVYIIMVEAGNTVVKKKILVL